MLTITQKKLILASMLKELDFLFCSDIVTKRFTNEKGEEVKIELSSPSDDEEVVWEVFINGKQTMVGFSQTVDFIEDFLKVNDERCFI